MKQKFLLDLLKPADRLVIPKSGLRLVQHHAIYLGKDRYDRRLYIENAINKGVQIVSEAVLFKNGYELTRVEPFRGNEFQRNNAINFAIQQIGKKYDLLNFNCEHYANKVQHRKSYSNQVANGLALSLIAMVLGVSLSK